MRRALVALAAVMLASAGPANAAHRRHHAHWRATKLGAVAHVPSRPSLTPVGWGPAPLAQAAMPPPATSAGPGAGTGAPSCPTAVGVSEGEYYTALSRSTVCAGSLTVQLRDVGQDQHDLRIVREDGSGDPVQYDTLTPGATATRTLTLTAGSYYLYCTLADGGGSHEAQGMHALLTVTG